VLPHSERPACVAGRGWVWSLVTQARRRERVEDLMVAEIDTHYKQKMRLFLTGLRTHERQVRNKYANVFICISLCANASQ
jgi:hypothetical protein